jgi:hypothetical protein
MIVEYLHSTFVDYEYRYIICATKMGILKPLAHHQDDGISYLSTTSHISTITWADERIYNQSVFTGNYQNMTLLPSAEDF